MKDSVVANLNTELDAILQKNDVAVEQFIRNHVRRDYFRRFFKWFIVELVFLCAIYWVPALNWNATAVGRLALIKVVRPFYNWEILANERCLIGWGKSLAVHATDEQSIDTNSIAFEECSTCENLLSIERQSNLSFDHMQSNYLWRNHPIIIIDSHRNWHHIHNGVDIIEFMKTLPDLMASEPCNIASNLLAKGTTVRKIIKQVERLKSNEKWFFHFRNCHFDSVKSSRLIIPYHRRPYYMPSHLPPFRSSWILVSHQYEMARTETDTEFRTMKHLNVRDLVIVMQLQGEINGRLTVTTACTDYCADHTFRLAAGESIMFVARFWNFYYKPIAAGDKDEPNLAITFITEFEWV